MSLLILDLMQTVLDIIHLTVTGLERDDPTRLRLVEMRPRDEGFADALLSCSISHNDPDNIEEWNDEEAVWPGNDYNNTRRYLEIGGLNQYFNLRFTVDFVLFFQELGLTSDAATRAAEMIMARIHHQMLIEGQKRKGRFAPFFRADDFGQMLVNATRSVKRMRMLPQGSDEETFFKGKMWLQFETIYEPVEQN